MIEGIYKNISKEIPEDNAQFPDEIFIKMQKIKNKIAEEINKVITKTIPKITKLEL